MKRSESRILTTHTGSLPRSPALRDLLVRLDRGEAVDAAALAREAEAAVRHVVARQLEAGIDVGNDGEQPRVGFSTYPARRMRGFGGASTRRMARDIAEHPDYASRLSRQRAGAARINDAPQAVAEVAYTDLGEATAECELFRRAPGADKFAEAFMTAASPGVIATIMLDAYYGSHERYVKALAREMRKEYELIVTRGFVLQLDCPDLAMERARFFQDEPLDGFLRAVALHVDAINEAIAGLPADRVRAVAEAIGDRTRVLAGVDCGFGTFAGSQLVEESVVWTKLRALREGADLATRRLWKSGGDPWQG